MSDEKKIIIDEDWKSQIEAEKEALQKDAETTATKGPAAGQMPPASLELLISTLATEAMVALGQFPHPETQQPSINPEHARYAIDMLEILQAKTKGNLEPGEDRLLTDLLHQLRMLFVSASQMPTPTKPQ
ncbi:MAG: DUF1844 domain-containing protein [Pirellulales bacterium]|nr:DUF1844 domain-containing protein [Pirellulales bacterium]